MCPTGRKSVHGRIQKRQEARGRYLLGCQWFLHRLLPRWQETRPRSSTPHAITTPSWLVVAVYNREVLTNIFSLTHTLSRPRSHSDSLPIPQSSSAPSLLFVYRAIDGRCRRRGRHEGDGVGRRLALLIGKRTGRQELSHGRTGLRTLESGQKTRCMALASAPRPMVALPMCRTNAASS